ncbi:MAG TPA: hypothetical protein VJ729_16595 [Nitrososphaeraceae archaeon]|nr:hypothetical protein [Nitrososphaeraceae archaeon]
MLNLKQTSSSIKQRELELRGKIENLRNQIDYQRSLGNHKLANILTLDLVTVSHELRHNLYLQNRRKNLKVLAVFGGSLAALLLFSVIMAMLFSSSSGIR